MKKKHLEVRIVLHFNVPNGQSVTLDEAKALIEAKLLELNHPMLESATTNVAYDKTEPSEDMIAAALKAHGIGKDDLEGKEKVTASLKDALERMP